MKRPRATWEDAFAYLERPSPAEAPPTTIRELAERAKGFLSPAEGAALYDLARDASSHAPCLEIGSYCGKSTLYLGAGCRATGRHPLFAVDHHRGSPEQQPGQPYFDPELFDETLGSVSTVRHLIDNVRRSGLDEWVIPIVADSTLVSRHWGDREFGLVFIDGAHSEEDVRADFEAWSGRVRRGGLLCFHDLYPGSETHGQAPLVQFERARALPEWRYRGMVGSLGVLERA